MINPNASYAVTSITVGASTARYNNQNPVSFDSVANLVAVAVTGGVAYIDPTLLSVRTTVVIGSNPNELISNSAAQQTYSLSFSGAVGILSD